MEHMGGRENLHPHIPAPEVSSRRIRGDCILLVTKLLTWPQRMLPNLKQNLIPKFYSSKATQTKDKDFIVLYRAYSIVYLPSLSVPLLSIIHLSKCWHAVRWPCTHSMPNSSPAQPSSSSSSTSSAGYIAHPWQTASAQSRSSKCLLI